MQDLRSRINMLNKMNGYETPAPTMEIVEPSQKELDAEEALVEATSSTHTLSTELPVDEVPVCAVKEDKLDLVISALEELKAEITKMNKHVNSIQKFIKKNS